MAELKAFRDGIFSNSAPAQKFGNDSLRPYNDGSLGSAGPRAFRDGVFSQSDPLARPGSLLESYSDGSLGATIMSTKQNCLQRCAPYRGRVAKFRCRRRCEGNAAAQAALVRAKKGTSGFGALSTDTKIGLGVVGVLALALVAMPIMGSRKRR